MGRTFDLLLPKDAEAGPDVVFTDSPKKNYVRKRGELAEYMWAIEPQNSSSGSHASNDGKKALCGEGPWTNAESLESGSPEKVAPRIRCKFCQARLVNAGVMDPAD